MVGGRAVFVVVMGVVASGCGGSVSAPTDANTLTTAYSGVFAGPLDDSGVIDFVVTKPTATEPQGSLTGTLLLEPTRGPIPLIGAVDASGQSARFSGSVPGQAGTLSCNGDLSTDTFFGTCVGEDFSIHDFGAAAGTTIRYCGSAMSNGLLNIAWNLFSAGRVAGGVYTNGAVQGIIHGTRAGADMSLELTPSGSATGHVSGSNVTGTWTITYLDGHLPPDNGTFSASTDNCP